MLATERTQELPVREVTMLTTTVIHCNVAVSTMTVDTARHQRLVKFTASNQCRIVRDYLVIEVDGMRVRTH